MDRNLGLPIQGSLPPVWLALHKWLPRRNPDFDYWWDLSGLHLALMLDAAGYTVAKQYDSLLFHYHWIVPYLGPKLDFDGTLNFKSSVLGIGGLPIEYSWRWNTLSSTPDVRFTMEAFGKHTHTDLDPLNQHATRELLHSIARINPTVDLKWFHHFLSTLFDHDVSKYAREAPGGNAFPTTIVTAVEFLPNDVGLKSYFIPRKIGQTEDQMPISQWEESFSLLDPENKARAALNEFLSRDKEGKHLSPSMLAVDDVAPEKSRMKLYLQTPHTSFDSVRHIITLGGLIHVSDEQIRDLRSLISAIMNLSNNILDDEEMPLARGDQVAAKANLDDQPAPMKGYIYYFDIPPGASLPEVKFYLPSRWYGPNDLKIAQGLTKWMSENGRGEYCDRYWDMLQCLSPNRRLEDGKGIQNYVSCLFKKSGELDITTYIAPEVLDPNHQTHENGVVPHRPTRRRSDSR